MLQAMQRPNMVLLTALAFAFLALVALLIGVVLLANIAGGLAQLLLVILPLALFSQAIIQ
ncbi:MAG: hypothetical protein BroJett018_42120 [Chloroflexota bacterium]|nr:hypothetical protein [Chloroflexota bacterium]NOG64940.1 hypothetical protein [Chloroflexota bacterium]GIK66418.1 MAG: hypothetical protein BroJett018_42120 [Chloroflexota bacterium]